MAEAVRWGILSTADINRRLIPGAHESPKTELIAVASRDTKRAEDYASEWSIERAYGTYDELLADPDVEAIYNPLPNTMHAEWSIKALDAGKHVLCEKPFAANAAEAETMAAAAKRAGRVLMEAFHYRHHPLAAERLENVLTRSLFDAVHRHRRKELAVGKLRQPFALAADTDESLDVIVPWRDVRVANRPIDTDALLRVGFKIEIAPAIRLAAPDDRTATDLPAADPHERLGFVGGIRVLLVIDEELAVQFIERAAFLLDRLLAIEAVTVAQVAKSLVPDRDMLNVVFVRLNRAAGFQNQRLQAFLGEFFGCPASGNAGTDYDGVVRFNRHSFSQPPLLPGERTEYALMGSPRNVAPASRPLPR